MKKKMLLVIVLLSLLAIGIVSSCGDDDDDDNDDNSDNNNGNADDDDDNREGTENLTGFVMHGEDPIENSEVTLFLAGSAQGAEASELASSQTDSLGKFELTYTVPAEKNAVLYLTATGPDNTLKMANVLGVEPFASEVVINERSTVATAYAMAQFISGDNIAGSYPGLQNAAGTLKNLVDISTGELASMISEYPNGTSTSTMKKFNSLANILSSCVQFPEECSDLFELSLSPEDGIPDNTLQAAVNIAHTPWRSENITPLYELSLRREPYKPALGEAPPNWTLALLYVGNGYEMGGPGNIAFDADGNAWVGNNYVYSPDPFDKSVCGDDHLLKITPTGKDFPGAPYQGGGLYGVGFGITIDLQGNVWASNFGFQGSKCPSPPGGDNQSKLWSTVSIFNSDGEALSPEGNLEVDPVIPGGYLADEDARPQGMVTDRDGNVWVANCLSSSVTKFVDGDPTERVVYHDFGLNRPFDMSIDPSGNAWVTSNTSDQVFYIDPEGGIKEAADSSVFKRPMGIAGDSQGNMWVANSGAVSSFCGPVAPADEAKFLANIFKDSPSDGASVTMIKPDGTASQGSPYTGNNLYIPWGIAVDGNDNVFVANFNGKRLAQICGADTSNCPPGFETGDPISPAEGYEMDGLVRNTGVQIDPSGNVWLTNNWETVFVPTNPGGHQLVVFIGLAAPVKTPLIGPPEKP